MSRIADLLLLLEAPPAPKKSEVGSYADLWMDPDYDGVDPADYTATPPEPKFSGERALRRTVQAIKQLHNYGMAADIQQFLARMAELVSSILASRGLLDAMARASISGGRGAEEGMRDLESMTPAILKAFEQLGAAVTAEGGVWPKKITPKLKHLPVAVKQIIQKGEQDVDIPDMVGDIQQLFNTLLNMLHLGFQKSGSAQIRSATRLVKTKLRRVVDELDNLDFSGYDPGY